MPASWEVAGGSREKGPLVATLIPPDQSFTVAKADCDKGLKIPQGGDTWRITGLPYGPARNNALVECIKNGYSGVFFLDADTRPLDREIIPKLIATGYDLIGGLYYQRFHPFLPAFFDERFAEDGTRIKATPVNWTPGDIVAVAFVPAGATWYSRRLIERMMEVFPRPFEWGLDIAKVYSEEGPLEEMSEDFMFSWRAKHRLGIQGYMHTGLACLHEIRGVVGPPWAVKGHDPSTGVAGVCGVV